ncbi:MAG: LuxR C-terminal-related transcriptional regulator [Angelakisella sp.]
MTKYETAQQYIDEKNYLQALELLCIPGITKLNQEELEETDKYLSQIPEEVFAQAPMACLAALGVDLRCERQAAAHRKYAQLATLRDACKDGTRERSVLSQIVCCAGLMMPKVDNARMLLLLAILSNEHQGRYKMATPVPLSMTSRRPSVLRGAKDLSEWGKNYRAVVSIVEPMFTELLGDKNNGVVAATVAELLYEHNDLNAAAAEVAAALSCHLPEVAFAGMTLLVRMGCAGGADEKRLAELLSNIERLIEDSGSDQLLPAYRALCAQVNIHMGKLAEVEEWLNNCGMDELHCTNNYSYELLTKAQALIALGRPRDAVTLLERILLLLREDFRPMDTIECLAHCAVAYELLDDRDRALDKLEEALHLAEPYRYVRIIADRGPVMLRLLSQLHKDSERLSQLSEPYLRNLLEVSKSYSLLHPALYSHGAPQESAAASDLTPMEIQILHLMGEGKTNKEIGEMLAIKLPTVKFHLANLFEKLQAPNRTAAVNAAKNLHLL